MNETPKKYVDYVTVQEWVGRIVIQMYKDNWRPDYIVGLTRGGLVPAVMLSHAIDVPMHTLKVSLRDSVDCETNCWMPEDAFGYIPDNGSTPRVEGAPCSDILLRKNILIFDDINDTGATLDWIVRDWQSSCLPSDPTWRNVWGKNVRFAVLVDNLSSKFSETINYCAKEINKAEQDVWVVFPWEH